MALLSTKSVLKEIEYVQEHLDSVDELLGRISSLLEVNYGDRDGFLRINEAEEYNKVTEHLRLEVFNIEKFVKVNDCKCVTNPRAFIRPGIPSDDGLLSNEIFGLTMDERSGIFGYIDLHGYFLDPSCYKAWVRINPAIKSIVHGEKFYKVDKKGQLVEDPEGNTGIIWLKSICDQLKFDKKDSITRDISRQYVEMNRNNMWINKYIVIPPFYRDKNTGDAARSVALGGINKLYTNLIIASNALKETQDYLMNPENAMYGRVQEYILNIYNWFCGNTDKTIKTDMGAGLSGKFGLIQGAALSKTANYTSRLVISAPELKVERPEDMMVTFEKSAIPISTCLADFKDFIIFNAKRFFENEFMGKTNYAVFKDETHTKLDYYELDEPMIEFSDERIKKEMDRFLHGYNNRFVPIPLPLKGTKRTYYMNFAGIPNNNPEAIFHRYLTWLDVFFIAAHKSVIDKQVLITRFPIDSYTNQFTTGIEISSTKETEPMYFNGEFYQYYPKIRQEDMGKDTSNTFIDTLRISNIYLPGIGGDYDGDQCTVKGVYTTEANEELKEFMYSKQNFVSFGCKPTRASEGDVIQALFALTRVLSTANITTGKIEFS